ncbi:DUF2790 domain-containing protein [Pseudomonas oryzae]|uniref:DUF2790 domain-containing protein n=1 Tax=Pseudomonas oryzae TaxID=1392877 RepID=A0A1H1W302_9PSED|nr:DUF2790 domain-containing protein [Pseudomonas oryzae]SDS91688.1 Protein of unknown function [Pseudomonas oryzae]
MRKPVFFIVALLASAGVMAEQPAHADSGVQPVPYSYGMQLDVAELVSIKEAPHGRCEPVNSRMTYRDSQGELHVVDYVKQDPLCE